MCVCQRVCMRGRVLACEWVCVKVCVNECASTNALISVHARVCIHVCVSTSECVCARASLVCDQSLAKTALLYFESRMFHIIQANNRQFLFVHMSYFTYAMSLLDIIFL